MKDCFARYREVLKTFDFHQTGESFFHRLSWHLRQARANDIVKAANSLSFSVTE